jgi:hypothetical protein
VEEWKQRRPGGGLDVAVTHSSDGGVDSGRVKTGGASRHWQRPSQIGLGFRYRWGVAAQRNLVP